jgi:hypothetical protein
MRALARHTHRLGRMGYRHPLMPDPIDQQPTTVKRQTSITVKHEDLRGL